MAVNGQYQNILEVDEIQQTLDLAKSPPSLIEEKHQDGTVATNEICEATQVDDVENHALDEEHEKLPRERSKETMKIDETIMAVKDEETRHPTLQLKPRQKPRKVRFLSEILARNETNSDIDNTKGAHDNHIPEETITLAKYSRKRKRNLPLAPSRETPSANNAAKDDREIQADTESAVAIIDISDSESKEDASSAGMCWESTYKPLEQNGNISCSSKLKGKMPLFENGQMQQEKDMPNIKIGESSTAIRRFGEGMLQYVNESIARTAEILRRQQLRLNKEKMIMEFDLNLPPPNEEDLEAVAALQLLILRDPERQLFVPYSDELNCTLNRNPTDFSCAYEESDYMIQLIKGKGKENKGN